MVDRHIQVAVNEEMDDLGMEDTRVYEMSLAKAIMRSPRRTYENARRSSGIGVITTLYHFSSFQGSHLPLLMINQNVLHFFMEKY